MTPGQPNALESDIRKITQKEDATMDTLNKVRSVVPGGSYFLMELGDYLLSDDDIEECKKKINRLKNIIWIIENKPKENETKQELPPDSSNLDMQDISDNDKEEEQEFAKENETGQKKTEIERKDTETKHMQIDTEKKDSEKKVT